MPDTSPLPTQLRTARKRAGLTQKQAAERLDMHRPTISEIEAGRRRVSAKELQRFAEAYDVSTSWLLGEEADERVQLAARALGKLDSDDLDRVIAVLTSMRAGT